MADPAGLFGFEELNHGIDGTGHGGDASGSAATVQPPDVFLSKRPSWRVSPASSP